MSLEAFSVNWLQLTVIFFWTMLTSFGLPGALTFMVSLGALADNIWQLVPVMITGAIAAIIGDILAYTLARKYFEKIFGTLRKFKFFKENESRVVNGLRKHEFFAVFVTRFATTELCAPTSYISGFEKLNKKKFVSAVILGEMVYATLYPTLGFVFKETWVDLIGIIGNAFSAVLAIVIAIWLLRKYLIKRKTRSEQTKNN